MAVDGGLGTKRQPQFLDGGAPDIAVDPTAVADYAAYVGNYIVDTASNRATAASWAWEGLLWRDTDSNKILWKFTSGAWKAWESDWITYTPTTTSGLTIGSGGTASFAYKYSHGEVIFKWRIQLGTGGTWSIPTFTLPTAVAAEHTLFLKMGAGALTTFSGFWEVTANYIDAPTGVRMYTLGGNPVTFALISGTAPVAVSAGCVLAGRGQYTPA